MISNTETVLNLGGSMNPGLGKVGLPNLLFFARGGFAAGAGGLVGGAGLVCGMGWERLAAVTDSLIFDRLLAMDSEDITGSSSVKSYDVIGSFDGEISGFLNLSYSRLVLLLDGSFSECMKAKGFNNSS